MSRPWVKFTHFLSYCGAVSVIEDANWLRVNVCICFVGLKRFVVDLYRIYAGFRHVYVGSLELAHEKWWLDIHRNSHRSDEANSKACHDVIIQQHRKAVDCRHPNSEPSVFRILCVLEPIKFTNCPRQGLRSDESESEVEKAQTTGAHPGMSRNDKDLTIVSLGCRRRRRRNGLAEGQATSFHDNWCLD